MGLKSRVTCWYDLVARRTFDKKLSSRFRQVTSMSVKIVGAEILMALL